MRAKSLPLILWVLLLSVRSVGASFHDHFVVYFPQVVRGVLTDYYETAIVVSNSSLGPTEVNLTSDLFPAVKLMLAAGQTEQVKVSGSDFKMGYVRLEATRTVAASAQITARPTSLSETIISEVTVQGQPPTSMAVVPIFRRTLAASQSNFAENTAIAIVPNQFGQVQLTLRDSGGIAIAERKLVSQDFASHFAKFISEIFPGLPASFEAGSLTIEFSDPTLIPQGLSATALYFRGDKMWAAEVANIDTPLVWGIKLKPTENVQQKAQEIASQYGFTILSFGIGDPSVLTVLSREEVARAVARDPRIEYVLPNRNLLPV